MHPKKIKILMQLFVVIMPIIIYLPTLTFDFVNWDDNIYIFENKELELPWLKYLVHAFGSQYFSNYHPVTMLSYKIDYSLWGYAPFGYHLTNTVLHCLNSLMLFSVIKKGTEMYLEKKQTLNIEMKSVIYAASVTLLFIVHPLQVETVAWLSERKNVLFLLFYLLSINFYLSYVKTNFIDKKLLTYTFIMFVLSILSKPMAVSLPVVLVILDYLFDRINNKTIIRDSLKSIKEKWIFVVTTLILSIVTIAAQKGTLAGIEKFGYFERILLTIDSYYIYILKTFIPTALAPLHVCSENIALNNLHYQISIVIILLLAFVIYNKRSNKFIVSMAGCYIIALLPVTGLVKIGRQCYAERYFYLPGIFLIMIICALFIKYFDNKKLLKTFAAVFIGGVFILITITQKEIGVWYSGETLWKRQIETYEERYPKAYESLASYYLFVQDYDNAEEWYKKALKITKNEDDLMYIYNTYGEMLYFQGKNKEALAVVLEALEKNKNNKAAHFKLHKIYKALGNEEASQVHLRNYELFDE